MNTDHINTYKALINAYAESHRRVNPVINTCLDNITAGSDAIDPDKVSCIFLFFLCPFIINSILSIFSSFFYRITGSLSKNVKLAILFQVMLTLRNIKAR